MALAPAAFSCSIVSQKTLSRLTAWIATLSGLPSSGSTVGVSAPGSIRAMAGRAERGACSMAAYPWIVPYRNQGQSLEDFPHLKRWFETIKSRPAVVRAYERAKEVNTQATVLTEESKRILFDQTAASVA